MVHLTIVTGAGRQLFERDATLVNSDAAFEEDGATAVDASLYSKNNPGSGITDGVERVGLSDDDDEDDDSD